VRDYLENGNISNAVNLPTVDMVRESKYRIALTHANVPNMVGQISTAMAQASLNIHNMINKSKGDLACTLVDLDSRAPQAVLHKIAKIRGMLMVRNLSIEEG
ncbi:MAG: 3-phosphoglycerate dehydrogenase, partial [Burkholderiales bacterium]